MSDISERTTLSRAAVTLLVTFALVGAQLLAVGPRDYPDLHIILDTGAALLSGVLALLLWDMGEHAGSQFPKWLSVSFAITFLLNLVHVLATVEWSGALVAISEAKGFLRPATWPPSVHMLSIGTGWAIWRHWRGSVGISGYALAMAVLGAALFFAFQHAPTYLPPGPLGITRPALVLAPLLWAVVGVAAWRLRALDRLLRPVAWMAMVLVVGNCIMLYSRAPADGPAMVAHLGKISGYLILFLSVMQFASRDVRERILAEANLARLNEDLDRRVLERTAELGTANESLEQEMSVRRQAEAKANSQVERLSLLHQITRAIGERQDLDSIFQVVVRSVESQLPVDFACLCLYDGVDRRLTVAAVGLNSKTLAFELAMPERAQVDIDQNGLSQCVQGRLVYEPDIAELDFPFPQRLARGGLRSMVAAPLQVESKVFGVLVVARFKAESFVSGECEFLRQLSEHAALAVHQAQLYGALQGAYDDLRQSQQAIMQQERLRALGQMASGIAHDINNALSPVSLYTESMLETETKLSTSARGYLEVIHRAVGDVTHTIARMREFYREREPQLALVPVKLNDLVEQVLDLTKARWSDMAMQRGVVIDVRSELRTDLPAIMGVESELREALINLVFNGVDALPDGGALTIRTRATASANGGDFSSVVIEVEDDGVGMDEETRRRCMEPFYTTKGERGTGLGLAMVYGVVQRHGAETEIRSAPGEGTTMCLSFPAPTETTAMSVNTGAQLIPPPRLRLLLVDDDPVLLKALRDALETDGHLPVTASDGLSGIDIFRAALGRGETFAAVITDLGMPYVDGRRVAAEVKAMSPSTPVILLTGWGQGLIADVNMPAHVDQVLCKPPKLREIREALAHHCQPALG
jgi:signal transduction histidine kinase/ActR/RegA family two-component response regulator